MKKVLIWLIVMLLTLLCSIVSAADLRDKKITVMQFGNKAITTEGLQTGDFLMCSEYALSQLYECKWFDLRDHNDLFDVAQANNIVINDMADRRTILQLAKLSGMEYLVIGNVTGLTLKKSTIGAQAGNRGALQGNKNTVTASVVMRIIDIDTGKIEAIGTGEGSSSTANAEIGFRLFRRNKNSVSGDSYSDSYNDSYSDNYSVSQTILTDQSINVDASGNDNNSSNINISVNTGNIGGIIPGYKTVENYSVKIGTFEVSDVQARNALCKAVFDAIYGKRGIMTALNGNKQLKIKANF